MAILHPTMLMAIMRTRTSGRSSTTFLAERITLRSRRGGSVANRWLTFLKLKMYSWQLEIHLRQPLERWDSWASWETPNHPWLIRRTRPHFRWIRIWTSHWILRISIEKRHKLVLRAMKQSWPSLKLPLFGRARTCKPFQETTPSYAISPKQ